MHPDRRFHVGDEAQIRALIAEIGVVHLFAMTPDGPMVAHVPVSPHGENYRFHIARGNRIARHLDGAQVVASAMGAHGYVSPDWYADGHNQVPTWNYVAAEIDGVCTELDRPALIDQINDLSAEHEARLLPKPMWTMAKVDADYRDRLLSALRVFELRVTALRGVHKLNQNKTEADRAGVVTALEGLGNADLAAAMR